MGIAFPNFIMKGSNNVKTKFKGLFLCLLLILFPISSYAAEEPVASINGKGYKTLQDAIDAAKAASSEEERTVTLEQNVSLGNKSISMDSGVLILDLSGKKLQSKADGTIILSGSADLTICDSTEGAGSIENNSKEQAKEIGAAILVQDNACILSILGGTFQSKKGRGLAIFCVQANTSITITGGNICGITCKQRLEDMLKYYQYYQDAINEGKSETEARSALYDFYNLTPEMVENSYYVHTFNQQQQYLTCYTVIFLKYGQDLINTPVKLTTVPDLDYTYEDICTNNDGSVRVWLPEGISEINFMANGTQYSYVSHVPA